MTDWTELELPFDNAVARASRDELDAARERHPSNPAPTANRLRVVRHGTRKRDRTLEVFCIACGTRHGVAEGHDAVEALEVVRRNATARPCCAAWVSDEMVTDYWLDRGP